MSRRSPKVMAIASAGGHWVQLMRLTPAWDGCHVTYVTTNPGFCSEVEGEAALRGNDRPDFFSVTEANRWQKFRLVLSFIQITWIILYTLPDVIATTGAAPGFFAIRIARYLRIKTIWIDSIANAAELSLSGQQAGKHATLWLTQWPHLAKPEGPYYRGAVL